MDDDQDGRLTRRHLLAVGAVAAASVTLPATNASAKTWVAGAKKLKPLPRYARKGLRRSRFSPHVGTPVKLRPRGGTDLRATLIGIEDVPYVKSLAGDQDAYTLRFRGPPGPLLAEGLVGIRHKHFGVVELYVSPLPATGLVQDYVAVVNRRVPRSARRAPRRASASR